MSRTAVIAIMLLYLPLLGSTAKVSADFVPDYVQGFETDISGWDHFGGNYNASRVASGTQGVPSASGNYHAVSSSSGAAGNWGGYNYGAGNVPTFFVEYKTSVDIYLNVNGGWLNDTLFDFDSSISDSELGAHHRDFRFNAGFFNDAVGPGAGTNRFVISASTMQQQSWYTLARAPASDPLAINTTGWYTFEHHFYDDAGVLAVDLSIYDSSSTPLKTWTLSNPADVISEIGGNNYAWFNLNEFSTLAFDNASLTIVAIPEPSALLAGGLVCCVLGVNQLRKRLKNLARRAANN